MLLKLPEEYKGIEKEYKAVLSLTTHVYWEDKEREKPYVDDMFDQMLKELDKSEIYITINNKETKVKLEIEKREKYDIYLIVKMKINMEEYKYDSEKYWEEKNEDKDVIELIHIDEIIREFKIQIQNFAIAVNISYPGLLEIPQYQIYVNNMHHDTCNNTLSSLLIAVTEAMRDNWPKINVININKTWNWLKKRTGFTKGMSTSPIERALTAFTYIYDSHSYEDLFYAMIGIEAIYVRNREGILNQIKDKSRALFGEPQDYMKRLKHMYNVRSRFIYGELNFPLRYYDYDDSKEFTKFSDEEYFDSKNLAQALLVASIQQFVLKDTEEIEFELKVK